MRVAHLLTTLATATALRTTRRALGAGAAAAALGPRPARATDEWRLGVIKDYSVTKKQASSVRIRPETMLTATGEGDTELKLLKVPLGRAAAASFAPEDQLVLAKYFSSRTDAEKIGPSKIASIMKASLQKQAANPQSPLQGVKLDPGAASVETRGGRRYVSYIYDADACRRLSEDGECLRRGTRYVEARVSVSLESQARTLEEQRRMDEGEMEQRYVDTLWVFTASAPKGAGDAALGALRRAADSFEVVVD
jgi:hypothetical protein